MTILRCALIHATCVCGLFSGVVGILVSSILLGYVGNGVYYGRYPLLILPAIIVVMVASFVLMLSCLYLFDQFDWSSEEETTDAKFQHPARRWNTREAVTPGSFWAGPPS
jgi:hypothetical protein